MKTTGPKIAKMAASLLAAVVLSSCAKDDSGQQVKPLQEEALEERAPGANSTNSPNALDKAPSHSNKPWPHDYKAEQYPGGAFAITDFGEPPSGDAVEVIKNLENLAKSGSSKASYGIYLKLNVCLDRLNEAAAGNGRKSDRQRLKECDGLTPDDYSRASEWLSLAAEQGSLPAQLVYASDGQAVLGTPADLIRNPDAVKEYKEKSYQYLRRAATHGSVDALVSIGNSYLDGIMLDADPVAGYAYFKVVSSIDPSLVSRRKLEHLESSLSSNQLMEARRMQLEIRNECCNGSAK